MTTLFDLLPRFLSAGVSIFLGAALLALDARDRSHRAFAGVLILRGLAPVTYGLGQAGPLPGVWWWLYPVVLVPLPFAAVHFAAVHPRLRFSLERWKRPWVPAVAGAAVLAGAVALRPELFWDLAGAGGHPQGPAADAPAGPLFVFETLALPVFAWVAWVFAKDAAEASTSSGRLSLLVISLAFGISQVFGTAASLTVLDFAVLRHPPLLRGAMVLTVLAAVGLTVALAVRVFRGAARTGDASVHRWAGRYLLVLPLPALSVALLRVVPPGPLDVRFLPFVLFGSLWRLAFPALVVYALVRHHLFGIDLQVKRTVERSTVVAAFLLVFFLFSEGTEALVESGLGTVLAAPWPTVMGLGAAALLAFGLHRLEAGAHRLADRLMPGTRPVEAMTGDERVHMYREQVASALADGRMTDKEARMLDGLSDFLGLDEDAAALARAEVERDLRKAGRDVRTGDAPVAAAGEEARAE